MLLNFLKKQGVNKGVDRFKTTSGAVLLDVRSKEEYEDGHIPESKNIDVGEIKKVLSLISDKNTPIFVYCHSGSRSGMAVNVLKSMGYNNVENIGGISSYAGLVKKGA